MEKGMDMLLNIVLLIVGFVFLIKGADFFVDGASSIASRMGIPQLVIGLTIVAFGTSAPEAAISVGAALKGSTGIAIGNVIGSNILNILIVLGITSCIVPLTVAKSTVRFEIPFTIFITILLVVMGYSKGNLGFLSGCILWVLFLMFFVYLIYMSKNAPEEETAEEPKYGIALTIFLVLLGMAGIIAGSNLAVDGATGIAKFLGVSDRIIGLTVVAFGTSLPELITSVTAGMKGKADIAIGNIVGSNIFNILFILGTTCLIKDVPYGKNFLVDGIVCIAACILLFACVFKDKKLRRSEGILMLAVYAGYFVYLLM